MDIKHEVARSLLSIEAVFLRPQEPFTWASGIKSPIYCDNRLTLTAPAVRTAVEKGLVELIRTHYPDAEVLIWHTNLQKKETTFRNRPHMWST